MTILDKIKFNNQGLVPAIAQDFKNGQVLMLAWMNMESINLTLEEGVVHYFSRSRNKIWKKGESSGSLQYLKEILIDCDFDTILLKVDQQKVACHTGRRTCFFNKVIDNKIIISEDIIIPESNLYDK